MTTRAKLLTDVEVAILVLGEPILCGSQLNPLSAGMQSLKLAASGYCRSHNKAIDENGFFVLLEFHQYCLQLEEIDSSRK